WYDPGLDLVELLQRVYPFRFLRDRQRRELAHHLSECTFPPGETIFRRHDLDQSVYLIAEGAVEVFDPRRSSDDLITVIHRFHYFGEWEAIFQEPRLFGVRARGDCICYRLSGEHFRELLQKSPTFAQGFGTILRDNPGIFSAFDRFKVQLLQEAGGGHISVGRLLPIYRSLEPALHPGAVDGRLDLPALQYAQRRLPANVTRTFAFLLVDELTEPFAEADTFFPTVPTAARRRDVWEVLPGKNLVLLRSGDSDLIDLLTCLCLYAVEARKIRERVTRDGALHRIDRFAADGGDPEETKEFLNSLPFSSREIDGLIAIWPTDTVRRISEITRHREMFSIDVRRRERTYRARRGELWTSEVARLTREVTGYDPGALPEAVAIHIISSNTHSVTNCLNPWFPDNARTILEWGRKTGQPGVDETWAIETDLVYSLLPAYLTAHPGTDMEFRRVGESAGQSRLDRTASTGIQVQLIDLAAVEKQTIDSHITPCTTPGTYIVNIDYAFGEQAEYVIRNLLMLFGENVRSVNFLGKAGALVGERGDILAPTAFVEQQNDLFQPLPVPSLECSEGDGCVDRIARRHPNGTVHTGPMLTVDGTLLQNRQMLNFYRQIWDVVGIEMEGTHYYRGILESSQLGVIRSDVAYRFFYYVSDLPLQGHSNLATPMKRSEGVPPLYAITRHVLDEISMGGAS
ncbi:MAG: DUF6909 family protein, partial [Alkalispirochaeta sp.]